MTLPPLDAEAILRALEEGGVDHIVIGGFAVIAHGVRRLTDDLDVVPEPSRANLARLAGVLRALDVRQLGFEDFDQAEFPHDPTDVDDLEQGGNFRLVTRHGVLDVMQWLEAFEGDLYPSLGPGAIEATVDGIAVRVAGLREVRVMKQAAGRPKDLGDLRDLAIAHPEDQNR